MSKIDLSRYAGNEELKMQSDIISARESRIALYGVVPMEATRTMDKKRFSVIADATLDEVIAAFEHVFTNLVFCDTCEEPATRMANIEGDDRLDRTVEYACDTCKFSRGAKSIRPTGQAASILRAKAVIAKLKDRR